MFIEVKEKNKITFDLKVLFKLEPNNKYRMDSTKYVTALMMKYVISLLNDDKINGAK